MRDARCVGGGSDPRFLRQHWKFLKTVVNKLFEFMHESHEGVMDMSVDTFLKIAKKCKKKFVTVQPPEVRPFVEEILENMGNVTRDLEPAQVHVFYEAVGEIIAVEVDVSRPHACHPMHDGRRSHSGQRSHACPLL